MSYREPVVYETIPFTKPPFWIRNGKHFVRIAIFAMVLPVSYQLGKLAFVVATSPIKKQTCVEQVEIRTSTSSAFACASEEAILNVTPHGRDDILVLCNCPGRHSVQTEPIDAGLDGHD
jgi:hypothetical protein